MKKWDEFHFEHWQQMFLLQKHEQKKGGNNLLWFFLQQLTHEMFKSHFKIMLHISSR
jgi:hypothetical protein